MDTVKVLVGSASWQLNMKQVQTDKVTDYLYNEKKNESLQYQNDLGILAANGW